MEVVDDVATTTKDSAVAAPAPAPASCCEDCRCTSKKVFVRIVRYLP
jgi:hypothetical protein